MRPILIESIGLAPTGQRRTLDLTDVRPGAVVAVVGENGAGKSMLLRSITGALYGAIDGYRGGSRLRDAAAPGVEEVVVVLWFEDASARLWKVQRRDGRRASAYLWRVAAPGRAFEVGPDGWMTLPGATFEPVPTGAKGLIGEVDVAIVEEAGCLPLPLWQAAAFADQSAAGDFLDIQGAGAVDRARALLSEMLGASHHQAVSDAAAIQRKRLDRIREDVAQRYDAARRRAEEARQLEEVVAARRGDVAALEARDAQTRERISASLADVSGARDAVVAAEARAEHARATAGRLDQEHRSALGRLSDTMRALSTAAAGRGDVTDLRARLARAEGLVGQLRDAHQQWRTLGAELESARRELTGLDTQARQIEEGIPEDHATQAESVAAALASLLDRRVAVDAARSALSAASEALRCAEAEEVRLRGEVTAADHARAALTAAMEGAAFVDEVPCQGGELWRHVGEDLVDCGACPALARSVEDRRRVPELRAEVERWGDVGARHADAMETACHLRDAQVVAVDVLAQAEASLRVAERIAGRSEAVAGWRRGLERLEATLAAAAEVRARVTALEEQRSEARAHGDDLTDAIRACVPGGGVEPAQAVDHLRRSVESAASADARVAALERDRDLAVQEEERLSAAAAQARSEEGEAATHLAQARAALGLREAERDAMVGPTREIARELSEARAALARLEGQRDTLAAQGADAERLGAALAAVDVALADWRLVERGFGPRGIQGYLIEEAGPRISEEMNRLLAVFFGGEPGLEVDLRTYDPAAPPSRREVCDLLVRAPGDGGFRPMRVSGGQRRPIQAALRGALSVIVGEDLGGAVPLAVWDELDTGLSAERRRLYLDMIRATGDRIHVVVSHSEEVVAQADRVLEVCADGVRWQR